MKDSVSTQLAVINLKISSLEDSAKANVSTLKGISETQAQIKEELASFKLIKQGAVTMVTTVLLSLLVAAMSLIIK